MWAVASLFRQFAHTNVHGTDSVNIENSPRYTDIFVQCIVMSMSRVSVCIHISWTACLKSSHWMFPLIMMATLLHSSSASSMWWVVSRQQRRDEPLNTASTVSQKNRLDTGSNPVDGSSIRTTRGPPSMLSMYVSWQYTYNTMHNRICEVWLCAVGHEH